MNRMLTLIAGTLISVTPALAADDAQSTATEAETTRVIETSHAPAPAAQPEQPGSTVQIALLLDTSNSMDGLIDQAKRELWSIVNELALARYEGERPTLQIALYEYGNNGLSAASGYIRMVQPFTDNLDQISLDLFALTTNGGDEFCGQVIGAAVDSLQWSDAPDDLKAIFIAGNEPFTQGIDVHWEESCSAAISRGIVVNTIFCGPEAEGIRTGWQDGALRSDGMFTHIDQNQEVIHVAAPQDDDINRLGLELNSTYVPYGAQGEWGLQNQVEQDLNAAGLSESSALARQACKASSLYTNAGWDLVDACSTGGVELAEVKEEDLPEAMQAMTPEQREAYLEEMKQRRTALQKQIEELNLARRAYVDEEIRKRREANQDSLDTAIISIIRELAQRKNYQFE